MCELCDPSLTCFEPEARGQWVEGMEFHHFYFKLGGHSGPAGGPVNITVSSPHVRVMGDVAVISFIRLVQKLDAAGNPVTVARKKPASGSGRTAIGGTCIFTAR